MSKLAVTSPQNGEIISSIEQDDNASLKQKISRAAAAQQQWAKQPRAKREALLVALNAALVANRAALLKWVVNDAGKTEKEAAAEVDGAADILLKTIKDASLPELNGMARVKERDAVGVVGLITSFNFPLAVANWTIAPALLAGNAVVWKPSEKTPLVALDYKKIFDSVAGEFADLLQLAIGGREIGEALVASEQVALVSATGSVAMGQGIKQKLAKKTNQGAPPILELGGNNGVIISDKATPEHLEFAVGSIMHSFLATSGQRCTNTRRLIVQKTVLEKIVSLLEQKISAFLASYKPGAQNDVGYSALIDEDAFNRFESAKAEAQQQGAKIYFGNRMQSAGGFYVEPCLAVLPSQTAIMHKETFAPLLFLASYEKFDDALAMLNAPENAGLVGGIYTQNAQEAEQFSYACDAGHVLINSPKGTGTPAFGMGFGGNKHSGDGEILNAADPLAAFTKTGHFRRIASNAAIAMDAN